MKKNKTDIKGDNNNVFSDINRSKINVTSNSSRPKKDKQFWVILAGIVSILALLFALIVDWDKFLNFFK